MATIQSKVTNGHKYWYIVESRRVNGKPRPVVLEYLGKADALLERLQGVSNYRLKSYAHGHIAAMLDLCKELDICDIINRHSLSQRKYITDKPVRHHLTVGGTLMLAIISRACMPISKNGFADWAKRTSISYMIRVSLSKVNSQHFWDMMDCMPVDTIADVEAEIMKRVSNIFEIDTDRILYDTTNYYTYIDTVNSKPTIAKRGKNKQKRNDLRQIGLALVVTKKDRIPIYHHSYEGNFVDTTVFGNILGDIISRMNDLGIDINSQTVVFDKGVNSKKNLDYINSLDLHFVGSLSPSHCKELILDAESSLLSGTDTYRDRRVIWGIDMTTIVIISDKLKIGLIRGIYTGIEKSETEIIEINNAILKPRAKQITPEQIKLKVESLLKKHKSTNFIKFDIIEKMSVDQSGYKPQIDHLIDYQTLAKAEDEVGFKIIMTTRHEWDSSEIVEAYNGQAFIEDSFKSMKDPHHLSLRPQYHWTNHKIRIHNFCCVIGYLLNALLYKQAREKADYSGCMRSFLDILDNIRLGSIIKTSNKPGRPRVEYSVEDPEDRAVPFIDIFKLEDLHKKRPKIVGISTY